MSVFDFLTEVINIAEGNLAPFPRLRLMRMVGRERRMERLEPKVAKDIEKIREDARQGKIRAVSRDMMDFVRKITKEEKIEFMEIKGEEGVEFNLAEMLNACYESLLEKKAQEQAKLLRDIILKYRKFSEQQFNDLEQVERGGTPWSASAAGKVGLDIGGISNVIITSARGMRMEFGPLKSNIDDIIKFSRGIKLVKGRAEINEKTAKALKNRIGQLSSTLDRFLFHMRLHFLSTLRIYKFLRDELVAEKDQNADMKSRGLPVITYTKFENALDKAIDNIRRDIQKEAGIMNKVVQQETRAAA